MFLELLNPAEDYQEWKVLNEAIEKLVVLRDMLGYEEPCVLSNGL